MIKLFASPLKTNEYVMFIPDIAYESVDKRDIFIHVQAWVYEKERRLGMTSALIKYLGINKSILPPQQLAQLYARTQLFRVDSERGKKLQIRFDDNSLYTLPITNKAGRSSAVITLKNTPALIKNTQPILFQIYDSGTPAEADQGIAIYVPPKGVSIISDIDDTIKYSNVLNKKQLLINTFLNDFEPIPGMSHWYNKMALSFENVAFHYVSSSPMQLYPVLNTFIDKEHFPKGSFHLREATTWRSVIAGKETSKQHKIFAIKRLLTTYPERTFILVGDSGEHDPEIYADIMRQYHQVRCIAIRDVTQETDKAVRYQQVFANIDKKRWIIFNDPSTLDEWCSHLI